jgi:predicted deacylase
MTLALDDRDLGSYPPPAGRVNRAGHTPGPLLLVLGGIHGNEPAGVLAARRVLATLAATRPPLRGSLVALAGNLAALRAGTRYVERDMNRAWTEEEIASLTAEPASATSSEAREQAEVLRRIEPLLAGGWSEIALLDLHSTSAPGAPFVIMGDTLQNRRLAFRLGVPVILGLEERVEGTLLSWLAELGHTAVCLEGGQNSSPATVDHHEAAIWITLVTLGMLAEHDAPDLAAKRALLTAAASELPSVVEVRHREPVPRGEPFTMLPGFANFDRIHRGQILATVGTSGGTPGGPPGRERTLASPQAGLLLMPRYQGLGDDAYFVGREVRRFWLELSAVLRRLRLEVVLPWLPGVRPDRARARTLLVDPRIARLFVLEILHLFGYRRSAKEGPLEVFVRRRDAF